MKTITATTAAHWIEWLSQIQAATQAVEDHLPLVPYGLWRKVHDAKGLAMVMQQELLAVAVVDVSVEVQEAA
jgi:hypothetical protein